MNPLSPGSLRAVVALDLGRLTPAVPGPRPDLRWVSPTDLLIEESYQRELSQRSIVLIRRIVENFDWGRLKPPICAEDAGGGLFVIDGQHTAIAAATHGGIAALPVLVVKTPDAGDRAKAFVGHNRDRLALQSYQIFWASVAAGDPEACTVVQCVERAGGRILKWPPSMGDYKIGDVICTAQLMMLVRRRTAQQARQVIEVLVKAQCAPIGGAWLNAVDEVLHEPEFDRPPADKLVAAILADEDRIEMEAEQLRILRKIPKKRALALALFRFSGKRRAA